MKKLFILPMIALLMACTEENIDIAGKSKTGEYLIFGDYYGMSALVHPNVNIYLLSENSLFEGSDKKYPSGKNSYDGNFSLDRTLFFDDVKDLASQIPASLLNSEEKILGCPDCSDGGVIYIETKVEGQVKYWLIDKQRVPEGLEDFVALVNEKIALLQ